MCLCHKSLRNYLIYQKKRLFRALCRSNSTVLYINIDLKTEKTEKKKKGKKVRLKILYGFKQNATPRSVLGVINEVTQDKSIMIGDIEITNKFTFFDVFEDQADLVLEAFHREASNFKISIAEKSGNKKSSEKSDNISKSKRGDKERNRTKERDNRDYSAKNSSRKKERKTDSRKESQSRPMNNYFDEFVIDVEKPWRKKRR